jgi:transposase
VRTAEKNRVEKLLEDAQITLSVVASDIFGVSGREMLAAPLAGERNPKALAQLARSRMRAKIGLWEEAFVGHFTDHHAFLLATMLARIDETSADIAAVATKIEELVAPFAPAVDRLDEITGVGHTAAHIIIAQIGPEVSRFPTPAQLCSWARFAPGAQESAGRNKGNATTGHGNPYPARVLGEAAVAAGRTDTLLGERYRRIARRGGKKRGDEARRRPSWRSAAPSWSSSGTCCPTPRPATTTSGPASTTTASARTARNATKRSRGLVTLP